MISSAKTVKPFRFQGKTLRRFTSARFIALMGGTGGGKTFWGPRWLMDWIEYHRLIGVGKNAGYLVLAPTADMARDMLVPAVMEAFDGTELQGEYEKQARIYHLPSSGALYFRSADEPLRIEGHHMRGAWLDEPSQMKAMIWPVVTSRVGFHRGPILMTGYPTDMGWYYHDVYKAWERGDPDYLVVQFASTENPMYPVEEFERARRTLPSWLFEMRYLGQFRKPFGLVYPTFSESCFVEPFAIPEGAPIYVGLDPSVFFGALFHVWIDGVYYAFAEYYTEVLQAAAVHYGELMARIPAGDHAIEWIYDPARLTDANELARCGLRPLYQASNPVLTGIATLTGLINSGRYKVVRGACPNFVDMMEKYRFPTDPATGDVAKANPIKKHDHLPDCARYVAQTLEGAGEDRVEDVAVYEEEYEITKY